jgi:hypothetical protein
MGIDQQPGIGYKLSNLGSSLGAALMMIGGNPEQKQQGQGILDDARARTSAQPPLASDTPGPTSAGRGLSGLSGIGTNPGAVAGDGSIKPLLPAGVPAQSPVGVTKPLFPLL